MDVRVYADGYWEPEDDALRAGGAPIDAPSDDYRVIDVPDSVFERGDEAIEDFVELAEAVCWDWERER